MRPFIICSTVDNEEHFLDLKEASNPVEALKEYIDGCKCDQSLKERIREDYEGIIITAYVKLAPGKYLKAYGMSEGLPINNLKISADVIV